MKTIFFTLAIVVFVFAGCEPMEPTADFRVSKTTIETYENLEFINQSYYSDEFEWDFGDGFISYEYNPAHYYTEPGIYTVRLAAFKYDHVDYSYITIEVVEPPTVLNIQVLEYVNRYPIEGASILVYANYNDWVNERNSITEIFTDKYGIAEVEGLAPGYYYLDVWEENHNNYALASEDIGFIKTPLLVYGKTSYFTAWVDYVPGTLKSLSRRSNIKPTTTKRVFTDTPNSR